MPTPQDLTEGVARIMSVKSLDVTEEEVDLLLTVLDKMQFSGRGTAAVVATLSKKLENVKNDVPPAPELGKKKN